MSAAVETHRDDLEATYAVDFGRDREPMTTRARFPEYRRRGSAPSRVSGMHCRRNKRWTWGSGRGARMLNARAFAGAVAFALASVASSVLGVEINMRTIGNPGNAASSTSGLGNVDYLYQLGTTEVTNSQYAAFLTAVGASNPNGIYDARMGSNSQGGITQSGSPGGFSYSVKPGFAEKPVTFVSWWSAARFINWLENGQTTNVASLENGSYTLGGVTSGAPVARNPGATYVLPTRNEWFKGAFHTGGLSASAYTTFGTNSNTQPTAAVTAVTLPNRANYAGTAGVMVVGSYTNSASHYDLYDTMGNVLEMTETAANGGLQYWLVGGAWNTTSLNLNSQYSLAFTSPVSITTTAASNTLGFRVAAVPEPSTYALIAAGVASLGGFQWAKRRRRAG